MDRADTGIKSAMGALALVAAGFLTLAACHIGDDNPCSSSTVMFYSSTDHTYHYGSVTGQKVPTSKVPSTARKVPGYKPYNPPKAAAPKLNQGPGKGYKAPAPKPAAPRTGKR
jgi:hypothetical protein